MYPVLPSMGPVPATSEAAGLSQGGDQVALTPSGGSVPLPAGDGPRYLPLEESGFYTIRPPGSDPERPFVLAVNVDLEESSLARLDPAELVAQVTTPDPGGTGQPGFEALDLRREDMERRQSVWRYLLMAAFALFVLETAISNWISRKGRGTPGFAAG